jgi:hypothetical protein
MTSLKDTNLLEPLRQYIRSGKPYFLQSRSALSFRVVRVKFADRSRNDAESGDIGRFIRRLEERLHTDANPKVGLSAADVLT